MYLTPEAVLKEFIDDVDAVGLDYVAEDWPDIAITYAHAKTALESRAEEKNRKQRRAKG